MLSQIIRHLAVILICSIGAGCAHSPAKVQGTEIDDTPENRQIMEILQTAQKAMQLRDKNALLTLISDSYFEDMGTPDAKDDYGYEYLRDVIIPKTMETAGKIFLDLTVHEVQINGNQAYADIRYNSRARLDLTTGVLWDSHKEFNRLEFAKENGKWLITRGL